MHRLSTNAFKAFSSSSTPSSSSSWRVASLLPSASEILCFIGGQELLVARSHECNFPPDISHLPIVTSQTRSEEWTSAKEVDSTVSSMLSSNISLYRIDENKIKALQPHLILTQDICNVCAVDLVTVQHLAQQMHPNSPEILSLNPQSLGDVLDDILLVGDRVGLTEEAAQNRRELENRIQQARDIADESDFTPNVAFIEWPDPVYVGGHWTPQLIQMAGGSHPLNQAPSDVTLGAGKSFPIDIQKLVESDPDFIICAPCGLQLLQSIEEGQLLLKKHEAFRNLRAVKENRFIAVDGDAYFNRPGIRLVDALEWLVYVLHKDHHPFALKMCPQGFAHHYIDVHDY